MYKAHGYHAYSSGPVEYKMLERAYLKHQTAVKGVKPTIDMTSSQAKKISKERRKFPKASS